MVVVRLRRSPGEHGDTVVGGGHLSPGGLCKDVGSRSHLGSLWWDELISTLSA
jgi:hypothetical protein